jgi:aminopeptidase-like protein
LPATADIAQIIDGLAGLPRDPLSAGSDAALAALARQYPMQMHAYPSGTQAGEDIVPEKWTCRDASVRTAQGQPVFSLRDHVNHVAACSWPFQGEVTRAELLEHLHLGEAQVPFVSMRGTRRWALCCTAAQAAALADERYTVSIESAFSFGLCRVGEAVLAGRSAQSILLLARYDRRNDAHNGMAAAALGIAALRALQAQGIPDCTVRLLLVSDRSARDAWLAAHSQAREFTIAVVDLDRVAADGSIALAGPAVLDAAGALVPAPAPGRIAPAPVLPVTALEQAAARVADALLQARS